jgi:hypothetical protein
MLALNALLLSGCGAPSAARTVLDTQQRAQLSDLIEHIRLLVTVELLRPAQLQPTTSERQRTANDIKVSQSMILSLVPELDATEAACSLAWTQLAGTQLGWPAAAQLSELLFQRCIQAETELLEAGGTSQGLSLIADAQPELGLGMLHLLTGDRAGARALLQLAWQQRPEQNTLMFLALALALDEQPKEAQRLFSQLPPSNDVFEASLREILRLAMREPQGFIGPSRLDERGLRPPGVSAALSFPDVLYRNEGHGFLLRYPITWTLYDEETAFPLRACTPLAELTLDLPLRIAIAPDADRGRVRLLAYSVPFGTSSESLFSEQMPQYPLPTSSERISALLEDSVHLHYRDGEQPEAQEGEVVLLVRGQMAFLLHWMSSVQRYPEERQLFEQFLLNFKVFDPSLKVSDECRQALPS